ncbi:hypothetical protein BGX38DRAFT_1162465 [Terfezia claveryi]|nr:hypothetical protein BGX38DRAFT_1162465 [Terfezia claveryi]
MGAQFYPSCSQITVTSSGSEKPPGTFNFVPITPEILFDIYIVPHSWTRCLGLPLLP